MILQLLAMLAILSGVSFIAGIVLLIASTIFLTWLGIALITAEALSA